LDGFVSRISFENYGDIFDRTFEKARRWDDIWMKQSGLFSGQSALCEQFLEGGAKKRASDQS